MPQCLICRLHKPDSQFPDPLTAPVCQPCMDEHSLQVDDLQVFREHAAATGDDPRHAWIAPRAAAQAPLPADALEAEATDKAVTCPNADCGESFEINPWFYGSLAECPTCGQSFIIRPPGTLAARWLESLPADHPARTGAAVQEAAQKTGALFLLDGLDEAGDPVSEQDTWAATPLQIEDDWRGPLQPHEKRLFPVYWYRNSQPAEVSVEVTDIRVWRGPTAPSTARSESPLAAGAVYD
jgi:hypothetical protein